MTLILVIVLSLFTAHADAWAAGKVICSRLTDGYWQVYAVPADGGEAEQLTFSAFDKRDPVSVRDGSGIVFRDNNGRYFSLNRTDGTETEILGEFHNAQGVHYSPVRDKVVFVKLSLSQPETSEIWIAGPQGEDARQLTRDRQFKYQPIFSPGGERIAFVRADETRRSYNIWIINADGSGMKQLTFGKSRDGFPDFSKDEKFMVFSSNRTEDDYDLYVIDLLEGKVRTLVTSPGLDASPRFSPDGDMIAFVSTRSGSQQIWTVDADGKNTKQLTQGPEESVDPSWLDDGGHAGTQ